MSIDHIREHQFTRETAPRQGGKRGRKLKLSRESEKIIGMLQADFRQHGQRIIDHLRETMPDVYFRVIADINAKFALAEVTGKAANEIAPILVVRWLTSPPANGSDLPPARNGSDGVPLLELQAEDDDGPEGTSLRDPPAS
jgi:hypothetical protein